MPTHQLLQPNEILVFVSASMGTAPCAMAGQLAICTRSPGVVGDRIRAHCDEVEGSQLSLFGDNGYMPTRAAKWLSVSGVRRETASCHQRRQRGLGAPGFHLGTGAVDQMSCSA